MYFLKTSVMQQERMALPNSSKLHERRAVSVSRDFV